jgi:membrane dipeptidase
MMKFGRSMRSILYLAVAGAAIASQAFAQTRKVSDEELRKVHDSALLIDTHNDVTGETVKGLDIGPRRDKGHTDIPRLKEGGVGAVFFAAYVSTTFIQGNRSAHRALEMIDTIRHGIVERYPLVFEFATTADGIEAARKKGKIAALIGIEGGHAIEDSLALLRTYYDLGVRYMTLTHSISHTWADSSGDAGKHNGLTPFGREVVKEMNRLGMMVDISHVSDKTFRDVLAISTAPVFASHSSCRSLSAIPRNMSDEMIAAMAKKGGAIHINFGCEFISQRSADTSAWSNRALRRKIEEAVEKEVSDPAKRKELIAARVEAQAKAITRATLEEVALQIDHAVKIAGIDAVGIGSDFDGVGCTPAGVDDVSRFPALTRVLLERGYTAEQIRKIYGGNLLRVMRAMERAAGGGR